MGGNAMTDNHFIRLVPDKRPDPLTDVEAIEAAKKAWTEAKDVQFEFVGHLLLTHMLARHSNVNHTYLRGCRTEALKQVEKSQAVLAAIETCIEAIEATRP